MSLTGNHLYHQLRLADIIVSKALSVSSSNNSMLWFLRPIFLNIELLGHGGIWLFLVPMLFLLVENEDAKEKLLNLELALVIDLLTVAIIKAILKRPRPPENLDDQGYLLSDKYSMPSGHSSRAILIFTFVLFNFKLSTFWLNFIRVWVIFVIASRLAMARHYVMDVIVGGILGYLEAFLVTPNMLWVKAETVRSIIPWNF